MSQIVLANKKPKPALDYSPTDGLTVLQSRAVAAMLNSDTLEGAARLAGCSSQSIDRWLKIPAFVLAVNEGKRQAFKMASANLSKYANFAVTTLVEVINDPDTPAGVRVRASEVILTHAMKVEELSTIQDRITVLELHLTQINGA